MYHFSLKLVSPNFAESGNIGVVLDNMVSVSHFPLPGSGSSIPMIGLVNSCPGTHAALFRHNQPMYLLHIPLRMFYLLSALSIPVPSPAI